MGLGDDDSSIDDLNEAIRLRPLDANQFLNRGIAYFRRGEYARAAADYSEVLEIDPRSVPAFNNRCLTKAVLGQDLASAGLDCQSALKLSPNDTYALTGLGLVALKQGQYARALQEYNAALAVNSQVARAYYGRGVAKMKMGDTRGGQADIDTAKGMQPNIVAEFSIYGVK
jgi:tetratricopeptide (TPR) repeat protein